jgi:hypothetical protein
MSTTYIWQRRHADGTFDLWQEKLTGSVVPEEGAEVEIEGWPWRVIDTSKRTSGTNASTAAWGWLPWKEELFLNRGSLGRDVRGLLRSGHMMERSQSVGPSRG